MAQSPSRRPISQGLRSPQAEMSREMGGVLGQDAEPVPSSEDPFGILTIDDWPYPEDFYPARRQQRPAKPKRPQQQREEPLPIPPKPPARAYKKGGKVGKYAEGGEVDDAQSPPRQPSLVERMAERARRDPILGPVTRGIGALRRATRPKIVEELEQRARKRSKRTTDDEEDDSPEEIQNIKKGGVVKAKYAKGGSVKGGNWIQDAIKKPGALRAQLGAKEGKPIPKGKLKAAASKPGKLGQRARLAQTLSKMKGK